MLKRILSALIGKKRDGRVTTADHSAPAAERSMTRDDELLTVHDAWGREMHLSRQAWRESVLLPSLQQKWTDPEALYPLLVSGLKDGFEADLLPATEQFFRIDGLSERSHCLLGIVLLKSGQLDAAESTLQQGIRRLGESGSLLTNLAKVYHARGEMARRDEILWKAINADPNQENGLLWWVSLQRELNGEAAYLQALRAAAALPGSWRAQLWLARQHLENKEIDAALGLYTGLLSGGFDHADALTMISGDLGKNGEIQSITKLVAPIYDEHKHGFPTGLNLLRAYLELGRVAEGQALLARMYALNLAPIKVYLDDFAQELEKARGQASPAPPLNPEALKIRLLSLDSPIWQHGLRNADWLCARKPKEAPEIVFYAFSKTADGTEHAETQREDDLGRLSRATTLYLAEAVHYWSHYTTTCYMPIVEGGGPLLTAQAPDINTLFDVHPGKMTYLVTGEIGSVGEGTAKQWHMSVNLWDGETRTKKATESVEATSEQTGALALLLEQRLLAHIGLQRAEPLDAFYQRPDEEIMPRYLIELGQSFILTLLTTGSIPKDVIWGERAMLDWPLNMALQWPVFETFKLMYISGLSEARAYRSNVLPEYKERSLQLLRDTHHARNTAVQQLTPLLWLAFDMQDELQAFVEKHGADTTPEYREWLTRLLPQESADQQSVE